MRFLMVFAVTLAACFGASLCGGWVVFELAAKLWPVIVFFSLVISVPVTLLLRQSASTCSKSVSRCSRRNAAVRTRLRNNCEFFTISSNSSS